MGGGIRDESKETRICFVTTGYLVRYLLNPTKIPTHLIIDEVHQRALDADLSCYLARLLSSRYPQMRIILMSATVDSQIYQRYFHSYQLSLEIQDPPLCSDVPVLDVGMRRYPVEILYLENLLERHNSEAMGGVMKTLIQACQEMEMKKDKIPPLAFLSAQRDLAVHVIRTIPPLGTAVLIFVSGIAEIEFFLSYFDGLARYLLVCIHSQIPVEEQENLFLPTPSDQVKVIVATNSAESSITIPDVDLVICLGSEKVASYNPKSHSLEFTAKMITQASATQRAGRTGRVRPGCVFRLYTRRLYDSFAKYAESEVLKTPLHDIILKLRLLFEKSSSFNGVIPILSDLPDTPTVQNVRNSFQYLYKRKLIDLPSDQGSLTPAGIFVSQMSIGVVSGLFLMYAVMLGIVDEAIIIAAALQLPKTPFRLPSPYVAKDSSDFNIRRQEVFLTMTSYDMGSYSEPIMLLNVYLDWQRQNLTQKASNEWCYKNHLDPSHLYFWRSNVEVLRARVKDAGIKHSSEVQSRSLLWDLIRVCFIWCGDDNILRQDQAQKNRRNFVYHMCMNSSFQPGIKKLIPPHLKYKILNPQALYRINVTPKTLSEYLSSQSQFVQFFRRHEFTVSILEYELNDSPVVIFYFFQKEFVRLQHCFSSVNFSKGIHTQGPEGWVYVEFIGSDTGPLRRVLGEEITPYHFYIKIEESIVIKTNAGAKIVKSFASFLNLSSESIQVDRNKGWSENRLTFLETVNPPETIIADVPQGIRLFNFLCQGRKDRYV